MEVGQLAYKLELIWDASFTRSDFSCCSTMLAQQLVLTKFEYLLYQKTTYLKPLFVSLHKAFSGTTQQIWARVPGPKKLKGHTTFSFLNSLYTFIHDKLCWEKSIQQILVDVF